MVSADRDVKNEKKKKRRIKMNNNNKRTCLRIIPDDWRRTCSKDQMTRDLRPNDLGHMSGSQP